MASFPTKWRANEQLGGGWAPTSCGKYRFFLRQRFPSHRIAAFGERSRPSATEWQLFKQLQRAHSAFKRTAGSLWGGGGFHAGGWLFLPENGILIPIDFP